MAMRLPRSLRKPRLVELQQVGVAEPHLVGADAAGLGHQAHDRAAGRGFAGAGFADDAEPLAPEREARRCARRANSPSSLG